jgi:hypothetical protein
VRPVGIKRNGRTYPPCYRLLSSTFSQLGFSPARLSAG